MPTLEQQLSETLQPVKPAQAFKLEQLQILVAFLQKYQDEQAKCALSAQRSVAAFGEQVAAPVTFDFKLNEG